MVRYCLVVIVLSQVMSVLYLRGLALPHGPRSAGRAEAALRRFAPRSREEAKWALREAGLWAEAQALESDERWRPAAAHLEAGSVLTPFCPGYPWVGRSGPGAIWRDGPVPASERWIAIVGSREVPKAVSAWAADLARAAVAAGFGVLSGGAPGCDVAAARAAVEAGGEVLEILPGGIDLPGFGVLGSTRLAMGPPGTPFTASAAMERNALVYSAATVAVVVQSGYREGGTWTGATDAMRRRTTPFLVRVSERPGHRALAALGALPIDCPERLQELVERALRAPYGQPALLA